MPNTDDLSTHAAAELCGVASRTVLRWVDAGVLPGYQTGGGRRRIRRVDLVAFMRGRGMSIPAELRSRRDRVAIVDDDRLHVKTLRRMLHMEHKDLQIEVAHDGFGAGALLFTFHPHLIILDLVMPGMDGFEVCRRIRADPEFDDVGVLVVTGHDPEPFRQRLEELGATEILRKPLKMAQLLPALERYVPEGLSTGAAPPLAAGG
jgi:excisionase family DNA binding protein